MIPAKQGIAVEPQPWPAKMFADDQLGFNGRGTRPRGEGESLIKTPRQNGASPESHSRHPWASTILLPPELVTKSKSKVGQTGGGLGVAVGIVEIGKVAPAAGGIADGQIRGAVAGKTILEREKTLVDVDAVMLAAERVIDAI